jgi:hypothetical protein
MSNAHIRTEFTADNAGPPAPARFPYGLLLAYCRGQLHDAGERARVEQQLASDPRWQAHRDSLRNLDAEMIAAWQDARDLERLAGQAPTEYCREVARSEGRVLLPLVRREGEEAAGRSRREWARHLDGCVYCRRMRRVLYAEERRRAAGLPDGEELLRDWVLRPQYQAALDAVTRRYAGRGVAADIWEDGPTITLRLSPREFLGQMEPVARLLFLDLLRTDEPAPRFLAYLGREEVLGRLRAAAHVRDALGPELARFCAAEGLADPAEVEARVTRRRLDDVLWRVAVAKLRGEAREAADRQALEAIDRRLAGEGVAPLAAIEQGLSEVLEGQPEQAKGLRTQLYAAQANLCNAALGE